MDDPDKCDTCSLRWGGIGSHPPCLKLSPEERKALGAYATAGRPVPQDPVKVK